MPEIGLTDISELRHNGHMRSKPKRGKLQIVRMQSLSMTDCAALRVLTINDSTFLSHISIPLLACYQIAYIPEVVEPLSSAGLAATLRRPHYGRVSPVLAV